MSLPLVVVDEVNSTGGPDGAGSCDHSWADIQDENEVKHFDEDWSASVHAKVSLPCLHHNLNFNGADLNTQPRKFPDSM